jgi:phosphate acetyltransferase
MAIQLLEKIKSELLKEKNPPKIIFPEGEEERIIEALKEILENNICSPILVGEKEKILSLLSLKLSAEEIEKITIIEPKNSEKLSLYAQIYAQLKGLSPAVAEKIILHPLFFSALALKNGDVDGMVAGAIYTSGEVIAVSKELINLAEGITLPSAFFLMTKTGSPYGENGALMFADASVNINPNEEELAQIAVVSGETAKTLFGWQPRVALLSFSTKGSAQHPLVDKVVRATQLAQQLNPEMAIDGELQGDAALQEEVAKRKIKEPSSVAGKANVLIFPDLDAANIAYKLVHVLGEYQALGPILQGFKKPLSDLSRGVKPSEIVNITAIISYWALQKKDKN